MLISGGLSHHGKNEKWNWSIKFTVLGDALVYIACIWLASLDFHYSAMGQAICNWLCSVCAGKQTEQKQWRSTGRRWPWFHGTSQGVPSCSLLLPPRPSWCCGLTSLALMQLCACVIMRLVLVTDTSPTSWWTCTRVEQLGLTLGMHLAQQRRWATDSAL